MPEVMTSDEFFGFLNEVEREESGGGGYVGKIKFELGFKVYASGMQNDETWFPFSDRETKEAAKAKAEKLGNETEARSDMCYGFWLMRDSVINRDVGHWQGDRFFCYPHWTEAAQEVIKPALETCAIYGSPYEFWGRLSFTQDPYGATEIGPDGEERTKLIAYPVEKFEDQDAAWAAVGSGEVSEGEPIPGMEGVPDWLPEYVKEEREKGKSLPEIAKEVDFEIGMVKRALEV